jgi:hypothetical protein
MSVMMGDPVQDQLNVDECSLRAYHTGAARPDILRRSCSIGLRVGFLGARFPYLVWVMRLGAVTDPSSRSIKRRVRGNGRMVGRHLRQFQSEEFAQGKRIGRPPRNCALRVQGFEIADQ